MRDCFNCRVVGCTIPWKENWLISRGFGDFFYLPGACSIFFRVNPAKSFNQPDFFYPERLFWSIIGSNSGEPGETGRGGGAKKIKKIGEFPFRGILQPTTPAVTMGEAASLLIISLTDSHRESIFVVFTRVFTRLAMRGVPKGALRTHSVLFPRSMLHINSHLFCSMLSRKAPRRTRLQCRACPKLYRA